MLMRTDPFRELDRLTQQVFGTDGTLARPSVMPMDAWREGDTFQVEFDLPGVDPDSIDLDVERNVVTVKAERPPRASDAELIAAERPRGVFSRQLILGDNLDTEQIAASYDRGVLTLRSRSPNGPRPARSRSPARAKTATPLTLELGGETGAPDPAVRRLPENRTPMNSFSTCVRRRRPAGGRVRRLHRRRMGGTPPAPPTEAPAPSDTRGRRMPP